MVDWEQSVSGIERDSPVAQDDPHPDWGFNEIDPDIATAPGEIDSDGKSFPYDRFGRVDAGGTVFIDSYTPSVFGHWLAIADSNGNDVRTEEIFGSDGTTTFDLSGGGDGDRLDPGAYVVVNANGEANPRALQPLCVQAYSATVAEVTAGPTPEVTVTVGSVVADPPAIGTVGLVLWTDTNDAFVELTAVGDGTYEGDLSGVDPGSYSLHALVVEDTADEQIVGLSGTDTAEVIAQTGLTFAVDGQTGPVTLSYDETVPYSATAEFEDGSTEDVTDQVSVAVTDGDPAVVDIDEANAEITGVQAGTVTLTADDSQFTDTVDVTVEPPSQVGLTFAVDGQSDSVTIDDGQTVPYTATAEFEDGSTEDVTDEVAVTLTSGDADAVDIDESAAEIVGAEPGTATLEADDGSFTDTVEVTVDAVLTGLMFGIDGQSDAVTLTEGDTAQYTATAVFSDGSEQDVTDAADVTSADPGVVSVDGGANEVTGESPGESVTVTAVYETETDTVDVTVVAPSQTGLTFAVDGQSDAVTIDDGQTVPYTATAEFEDGSEQDVTDDVAVTVTDGDPAVVDIDESGAEITGAGPGTVTLEADDGGFTDTVGVTVEAVLAALEFEIDGQQDAVTLTEGDTVAYSATAVFSDGSQEDVTAEAGVTSGDTAVVSVDEGAAEVTGEGPGSGVTVTAAYETETDTVDVTVPTDGETGVTLPDATVPPGGVAELTLDGTAVETVTVEALWTDWAVTATDADGAETTDAVQSAGQFELSWESQQAGVAPTVAVTPPERYVGGEYELVVTGVGGDGSTAADTATLAVDGEPA